MGLLIKGQWHTGWYDTASTGGEYVRKDSQFRDTISADHPTYQPEAERYHLFVSLACPWAHRTLIFRVLKGLESVIGVTVVKPEMLDNGWEFTEAEQQIEGYSASPIAGIEFIHQVYTSAKPDYSGRVTVPVLWDTKTHTIVNNESADIIRILNSAFNDLTGNRDDYYPESLRGEIDAINEKVYDRINNGVYKVGFATTQSAYEGNFRELFTTLDQLEERLNNHRYLAGEQLTEADWRLFTTLIRFDSVYHGHFKCNLRMLEDYPNLSNYLRELYQHPRVADTVDFDHIKTHYYYSHDMINPTRIVPLGPAINYQRTHNRNALNMRRAS